MPQYAHPFRGVRQWQVVPSNTAKQFPYGEATAAASRR
ncbi:hypothetical protein SCG7086_CL_00040 [Chlamydiales bacterium SCGC AG-110-P3]|nr:hypothetical protein SCG7086_CL_00040 [Chlamydiales bacterium SCGC AG-110-P3]